MTPDVTAVIVTADSRDMVLACVASLPVGTVAAIVVVDNASTDGTAEAVGDRRPDVDVVPLDTPVGFARACNAGAARATSANLLFLNSDIVVRDGAVERLLAELDSVADAVAAGGRLVDPGTDDTQVAYLPKRFPTAASLAVELTGASRLWPGNPITRAASGITLSAHETTTADQPAGACTLVRREAFEAVRGFDEGYWFWYEDVDLARRLADRGQTLYVPTAVFEHLGGASFSVWSRERVVRSRFHGLLRYVRTHLGRGGQTVVAGVMLVVLAARVLSSMGPERRAYGAAWLAAAELLAGRGPGRGARALRGRSWRTVKLP